MDSDELGLAAKAVLALGAGAVIVYSLIDLGAVLSGGTEAGLAWSGRLIGGLVAVVLGAVAVQRTVGVAGRRR